MQVIRGFISDVLCVIGLQLEYQTFFFSERATMNGSSTVLEHKFRCKKQEWLHVHSEWHDLCMDFVNPYRYCFSAGFTYRMGQRKRLQKCGAKNISSSVSGIV